MMTKFQDQIGLIHIDQLTSVSECFRWSNTSKRYTVSFRGQNLGSAKNPYQYFRKVSEARKSENNSREAFTDNDLINIVQHFKETGNYYSSYIEFLILTGVKLEEAIALTWDDISLYSNTIKVLKTHNCGIINHYSNTEENRMIPINSQLLQLLMNQKEKSNHNLVFPSPQGGYIDQHHLIQKVWKPEINLLVKQNQVSRYLSPHHLRHTFIAKLIRNGLHINTVAKLSGHSPEIILKDYLELFKKEVSMPLIELKA